MTHSTSLEEPLIKLFTANAYGFLRKLLKISKDIYVQKLMIDNE